MILGGPPLFLETPILVQSPFLSWWRLYHHPKGVLPNSPKHFRYLKWRNPHLYKLYGYGLCKGSSPPPKNSRPWRFSKPSILGTEEILKVTFFVNSWSTSRGKVTQMMGANWKNEKTSGFQVLPLVTFLGGFKWPFQRRIVTSIWVIKRSLGRSWFMASKRHFGSLVLQISGRGITKNMYRNKFSLSHFGPWYCFEPLKNHHLVGAFNPLEEH